MTQNAPKAAGIANPTTPPQKIEQRANMARCGACSRYTPDTVNPAQGAGRCAVTVTGLPPAPVRGYGVCYPFSLRYCAHFQLLEDKS